MNTAAWEEVRWSVRSFVQRYLMTGDLYLPGGRVTAQDGISAQTLAQKKKLERRPSYKRELLVAHQITREGVSLSLRGRVDGADFEYQPGVGLVEEFKASRFPPPEANPEHLMQARLYAAMLSAEYAHLDRWQVRLIYVDPDTLAETVFSVDEDNASLTACLELGWQRFLRHHQQQRYRQLQRDAQLHQLTFPFEPRRFQKATINRVYRALSNDEPMLLEAPTGSGKTIATLYPALMRLERGAQRLFFLTSKTTGQTAAQKVLQQLPELGSHFTSVTLRAKEKLCPVPGMPCDPQRCDYARGYYDRRDEAVNAVVQLGQVTAVEIQAVAEAHTVCPFELSLDAAQDADLVVADYNYLFDPVVRLHRFSEDPTAHVLIDEAHQLTPRVSASLSLNFERHWLAELSEAELQRSPHLTKAINALDRKLLALRRVCRKQGQADGPWAIDYPQDFVRACERVASALVEQQATRPDNPLSGALRELLFATSRWARADGEWLDQGTFVFELSSHGRNITVHGHCIDPAPYIRKRLSGYGGHVRLSATVSPESVYQAQHGFAEDGVFARAGSPFERRQLGLFVVPDVPTLYRKRREGLTHLIALANAVLAAAPGRYLVGFPSYAYLDLFSEAIASAALNGTYIAQTRDDLEDPHAFLERIASAADGVVIGVVLGGVFSESLDFDAAALSGIIVVSAALPPPSYVREETARHFDAAGMDGHLVSYTQPAMSRVVQLAGRLIRSPEAKGVVVLVDQRFTRPQYQQFFPQHWQPSIQPVADIQQALQAFWGGVTLT